MQSQYLESCSHSLSCSLSMHSPIDREICRSHIMEIVLFLCFHHFMDGHSLSLSFYATPIDREICRSCIVEIVPFLCFHHFTDGHSLSLSLSMQSPIDREICRSCIVEIVPFLCFQHFTDGHSLSLFLCNLLLIGKYADLVLWR